MKCPSCGEEAERGMRLVFRLTFVRADFAGYGCVTPGATGGLRLPRSDDEPAPELAVYVEGVG